MLALVLRAVVTIGTPPRHVAVDAVLPGGRSLKLIVPLAVRVEPPVEITAYVPSWWPSWIPLPAWPAENVRPTTSP